MKTDDVVALNQWYPIDNDYAVRAPSSKPHTSRLLGQDIAYWRAENGDVHVCETAGGALRAVLPIQSRYGFIWTSLGDPGIDLVDIPEAAEADRRYVACGWTTMRTSAPRLVENFLDMAHFPFVHPEILGIESHPEVLRYDTEIRADVDEVWATNCRFFQPRVTAGSSGALAELSYRVPSPFLVMLYRVPPENPHRKDVIALFIQPIEEDLCRAQPVEWLVDRTSSDAALLDFEQTIFLQDRIIVENQRPLLLPLDPRAEIPTRADATSVTYRRWLKAKGLRFGVLWGSHAPPVDAAKTPSTGAV